MCSQRVMIKEKGGGALIRSLARVAKRGASKWGEHVASAKKKKAASSMQKSSSMYISELHQKIQKAQSRDTVDSPDLTQQLDLVDEGNAPTEHFVQEILAYMLAGAAAGSAFAAATAGAFIGTSVIALGAVATTLFATEEEEDVLHLMEDDELVANEDESGAEAIRESESCDYNGEEAQQGGGEENNIPTKDKLLARRKLDRFVLKELERCYNGNPRRAAVDFAWRYPKDVCLAGESDNDEGVRGAGGELSKDAHTQTESAEEQEMKLADAIEEVCSSTETCGDILPAVEEEAPKRVEVVWHDEFNSASDVHYYTQTQVARHRKKAQRRRASSKAGMDTARRGDAEQPDSDHWVVLTDAERDGALLLSESFRVASSAFGLVADAVRFTGESAAATAGGVARLAGGAVRVSGWAVGSFGEALEKGGGEGKGSHDDQRLPSPDGTDRTRKRQVAGKSVRLIGDAIEQVADSLLLAGSATERVAFAAAGAAEGTVRIVEEFASSLSEMFRHTSVSSDRHLPQPEQIVEEETVEELGAAKEDVGLQPTEEEAMSAGEQDNDTQNALSISSEDHISDEALAELFRQASTWVEQNTNAITADTVGVPSIAPEVLGVLLICFLASIMLLSPKKIDEQGERIGAGVPREVVRGNRHNVDDHDTHSTLSDHSTVKAEPDGRRVDPSSTGSLHIMTGPLLFLFSLPLKLARAVLVLAFRIVLSKKTLLLVIYLLGWAFVSRTSQHRNTLIQRKSEHIGFRSAIQTIGQSPEPTAESAVWLNSIIYKLWRIRDGGLEPLLSASASATLAETLARPYSKPSAVAHVALKAFTFGSSPPFVSRLVVDGVDDDRSAVYLTLDVGMLLQDADLILALTPSSLEYKSLPSTQVSVNSIFVPKATLSVAIQCTSVYPYVSHANVSLVDIPDVNLRVDSQGVDFGSLPVVSQWIKTSINATLAQYLQPQYVSIDVSAWLGGEEKIISYFDG